MRELDNIDYKLLESVEQKARYLHMGRIPIGAIRKCFELVDMGFLQLSEGNIVTITELGKSALETHRTKLT